MQTPSVSVVLPMKDAGHTLGEAIESVLAERDVSLELVCVDDDSRDETPFLVRERARTDPRVRLERSDGPGVVAALRTGVRHARAALIGRMDADDVNVPGRFAAEVAFLRARPDVAVVGTCVSVLLEDGDEAEGVERHVAWMNALITPEDHARERFVESPLCHPSTTFRRDAYEAVGGYREGPFPEDYDLWLRLVAAGHGLAKLPETMLAWRHRHDRVTFTDPRCSHDAIRTCKAMHLAAALAHESRSIVVWGAGRDGYKLARALREQGVSLGGFVDIDPKKIGGSRLSLPIRDEHALTPGEAFVIVCVGTRGARAIIRDKLHARGFEELRDFVCAA